MRYAALALLFASVCYTQPLTTNPALLELVETERAFARTALEKGIRESFLEYFADSGIVFRPHPIAYTEYAKKNPAPAHRPPLKLEWEPIFGDVSGAGDLGYDTGPSTLTDTGKQPTIVWRGYFFSIWKKQPRGVWRVVVDAGSEAPALPTEPRVFRAARSVQRTQPITETDTQTGRSGLLDAEQNFLREATAKGITNAYINYLRSDARLHRNGMLPVLGRDSIRLVLSQKSFAQTWKPMAADVAASADLGYTYGSYEINEKASHEKGYYVRVWKRNENNAWKVVLDLASPIPPERK